MVFSREHLSQILEGVKHFNSQHYWECHEFLEDAWMEEPGPVRNVYWAIIQVSTAMVHFREGNIVGSQSQIAKACDKFIKCEQSKVESTLLEEHLNWNEFKRLVKLADKDPSEGNLLAISKFKFPTEVL